MEQPLQPEQQLSEEDRQIAEYHQRVEQASRMFNLEEMTGERLLLLNSALEAHAVETGEGILTEGLEVALSRLPGQNLDKAYELMTALAVSDNEYDKCLATVGIGNLLCEENAATPYNEDSSYNKGIQLWLKLLTEGDPDTARMAKESVLGKIATIAAVDISDDRPKMAPETVTRIVEHLADLIGDHHPYLRHNRRGLSGGIFGSESTQ